MAEQEKALAEERQKWQLLEELNRLSAAGNGGEQQKLVEKRIGLLLGDLRQQTEKLDAAAREAAARRLKSKKRWGAARAMVRTSYTFRKEQPLFYLILLQFKLQIYAVLLLAAFVVVVLAIDIYNGHDFNGDEEEKPSLLTRASGWMLKTFCDATERHMLYPMDWFTQINVWIYVYTMQADLQQDSQRPMLGRMNNPRLTDKNGTMRPLHLLRHIKGYKTAFTQGDGSTVGTHLPSASVVDADADGWVDLAVPQGTDEDFIPIRAPPPPRRLSHTLGGKTTARASTRSAALPSSMARLCGGSSA